VIALLVVAVVLGLDQLSKQWALAALGQVGSTIVLPGPVDLTLVFNRSNAFGLVPVSGELTRWGLAGLSLAVAAILARVVVRHSMSRVSTVGLALIASKLGLVWVFNVADSSIDLGIGLLLLS
jgi:signal peptidase II